MYAEGKTVAIVSTGLRYDIYGSEVFQESKFARPPPTCTTTLAVGTGQQIVTEGEIVSSEP